MSEQSSNGHDLPLAQAAGMLGISLSMEQADRLEQYCHQLWTWNEKINLTRHTCVDLFVKRDLLDSAKLAAHLGPDHEILDLGTGGGVPGVILAILRPDLKVSVCDSVGKKAKAVQDIIQKMELPVAVYPCRVQTVLEDLRFHSVVTRATGSISQLLSWLEGHWTQLDNLLAIKGPRWIQERGEARHRGLLAGLDLRCLETYNMPDTDSQSVILSICKRPERKPQ